MFVGDRHGFIGHLARCCSWLRRLKWVTEVFAVGFRRLPACTRRQLAAALSADLLAEQEAPVDPRLGTLTSLRASTFSSGHVLFSEEKYLRRQRLHLSLAESRPWLVFLLCGALAMDLDGLEEPLFLGRGHASLLLTESQDVQCTVFSVPTHVIRLGLDPALSWNRDGLIRSDDLSLLQPMLQLLHDSYQLASASDTTKRLTTAIERYILEALEPSGVALVAPSSDPLQVLIDWLPTQLDQELRLVDLAAAASISPRRLQELCQARFRCTPMELLRQHRLDAFRADLSRPKENFAGIANLLKRWHLPDSNATRAAFENRFGHSPSEWRRRFLMGSAH